jgi:hypothetical protein
MGKDKGNMLKRSIFYELKGIREEISKLRSELKAGEISKLYMLEKAAK